MTMVALSNVTSGEVSPSMRGRADVARYQNAAQRAEDWILLPTGMWISRSGFEVMGLPKSASTRAILVPFIYDRQQAYVLEVGVGYFRIWHPLGRLQDVPDNPTVPVEVATVFEDADLDLITWTQSTDFLFVFHEKKGIYAIQRRSQTDWSIVRWALKDGPYLAENTDAAYTLTLGGGGANTDVSIVFTQDTLQEGDEGRPIRILNGAEPDWRWVMIKSITDARNGIATVMSANGTPTGPTSTFRLGLYSDRLGWPHCGTIFGQRLVLAGALSAPDRLDGSVLADYANFGPGVNDDQAWGYGLGTPDVNQVLGLVPHNDLLAFTVGREVRIAGDSTGATITPTSIWTNPVSTYGCSTVRPLPYGNAALFTDPQTKRLRSLTFSLGLQNYSSDDLTLLADHIAGGLDDPATGGFTSMAVVQSPVSLILAARQDGTIGACTYLQAEQVLAWVRWNLGGGGVVESLCSIPGPDRDELWALVRRDLPDGTTLRTIERQTHPLLWDAAPETRLCLDGGLTLDNTPAADLVLSATSGNAVACTASAAVFAVGDVGRLIKVRYALRQNLRKQTIWKTAVARIAAFVDSSHVTLAVVVPFQSVGPIVAGTWRLTVTEVSGLDYAEGQALTCVLDGAVQAPKVVVGGKIALDMPAGTVHVGWPYTPTLLTLPLDPGPQPAVGQGRPVRVPELLLRCWNSVGGQAGPIDQEGEAAELADVAPYDLNEMAPSQPPRGKSRDIRLFPNGGWTTAAEVLVQQTQPLPLNVQLLVDKVYAPWVQP